MAKHKQSLRKYVLKEPPAAYGGKIVLYQAPDGSVKLDVRLERETIWLNQKQMAELFATERSVITKHLRNIFRSGELDRESVCAFFAHTASDGKTYQVAYYNLDAIISVGYRVNSQRGTQFRIWATQVLRDHLVKGYTVNARRPGSKRSIATFALMSQHPSFFFFLGAEAGVADADGCSNFGMTSCGALLIAVLPVRGVPPK